MRAEIASPSPLRVAIVAPSMGILGGQAVQASRLIAAWDQDPDVRAWLVPIDPQPPGPLRHGLRVKYLRTLLTQLMDAQCQLEANANMIRYQDQTMGKLVNEVAKIG